MQIPKVQLLISAIIFINFSCSPYKIVETLPFPQISIEEKTILTPNLGSKSRVAVGNVIATYNHNQQTSNKNSLANFSNNLVIKITNTGNFNRPTSIYLPSDRDYEISKLVNIDNKIWHVLDISRRDLSNIDTTLYSQDPTQLLFDDDGKLHDIFYIKNLWLKKKY